MKPLLRLGRVGAPLVLLALPVTATPENTGGGEPGQHETMLLSRAGGTDGDKGDDRSFFASISGDGRYVAFASHATNLHPDDTDDNRDVFVRDAQADETILVNRASGADGEKGNAISYRPVISAGGRYVVFDSEASNLHPDATDDLRDVYLRDLLTHETILVSRASGADGVKGNTNSFRPSISADGRYVAFYSFATNLHPDDTDLILDVFVRDLQTDETILVSRASGADGVKGNFDSRNPSISADGGHVAFESRANSIHPDKNDSIPDVFVRDLQTHETILVSRADGADGDKGNGFSQVPTISADGRCVAFYSHATNLHPDDTDSTADVLVRDLQEHETILISRASGPDGEKGNGPSLDPSIAAGGGHVAFYSRASNVHPDKADSIYDVLVRDLEAHETLLASRASSADGAKGNADSIEPAIAADGRYVAFYSRATNLHPDDPDDDQDVYRRDLFGSPPMTPLFEGLGDLPGGSFESVAAGVSADGAVVVGRSVSANAPLNTEAFRWEGDEMEGLGDLPGGFFWSEAHGTSASGSVVVGLGHNQSFGFEAFRWQDGALEGLGDFEGGPFSSLATAVSADGSMVVGIGTRANGEEAFRWQDGELEGLGLLPGGNAGSGAFAISADGSVVVGRSSSTNGLNEAFRWEDGELEGLGDLPGGGFFSWAHDVSADGSVVVGRGASAEGTEAFRWQDGEMEGLGDLPGGLFYSEARGVSADGSIVVGFSDSANGDEAFLWTAEDGMRNLKEVLEDDYDLDLTGWTLVIASGVSDDGTVVVGAGTNPSGDTEAWRAVLPPAEPGPAELAFDPSSLDFGDVEVGTTSDLMMATLQNTGDADATGLVFSTPGDGFDADTGDCGTTLPAGSSCDISVTFTPSGIGQANTTLEVGSDEGAAAELGLVGNGVEPMVPPHFEGLGDLPGSVFWSEAYDVSADGSTVVGYSFVAAGREAFRWANGTMEGLGELAGGSFFSAAWGVSADGSVVVGYSNSENGPEAFRWQDGEMQGLGDLPGGDFSSFAYDVSADGSIVVGYSSADGGNEAFRWQDGEMQGLGDLPGGTFFSRAWRVSADGSVVSGYSTSEAGREAFRWEDGAMEGLGDLPGGDFWSEGHGISADGSVVVGYGTTDAGTEAFRWQDGAMDSLGDLPGGKVASSARAVSADGSIVVGQGASAAGFEAFIWTPEDGIRNLKEMLEEDHDLDLTGWMLRVAYGISDDGTVIVGYGINPSGDTEAWRAVLPPAEPGPAELAFDPSSLDFGDVEVGTTSDPMMATLQNTGDADATGLVFSTPGDGFDADTGDCGTTLPAGSSCDISVAFTPNGIGPATATLEVGGDDEVSADLGLTGIGIEPAAPIADISPDSFAFELEVGSSETQILNVGNLGSADLTWSIDEAEATPAALHPTALRSTARHAGEQEAKLTASDGEPDAFFGRAVSVQGDTAVIGAAGNVDGEITPGSAYVFTRSDGSWTEQIKLVASDATPFSSFGNAVALDGDTVLIGAITTTVDEDVNRGAAYVFVRDGDTWVEQAKLVASDGASGDNFGSSVSLEGDTALIGAHTANVDGNSNQGAAYLFTRDGDTWTEQTKLTASDGALLDNFGSAVALQGDTILIGAGFANVDGNFNQGAVYVFGRDGGDWLEQDKLTASDGAENLGFGNSLALSGDTVLIGAPGDQVDGVFRGAAYVLVRSGDTWLEEAKLTASDDGSDGGELGSSVALVDDTALAGAPWTFVDGNGVQGAAWLFARDGTSWSREAKLTASDGSSDDFLGGAVALADDAAFTGAWLADVDGNSSQGAVYVFSLEGEGPPEACDDPVDISWLSVLPDAGTTPPQDNVPVDVTVDTTDLEPGEHTAQLCVLTNDPNTPLVAVPVTLTVTGGGGAELTFDPSSLDFGDVVIGTPVSLTATLTNTGDADATGLTAGVDPPDNGFDADISACGSSLPAGQSCTVDVTFTPVQPGAAEAALEISSDEGASALMQLMGEGVTSGSFDPFALEVDPEELLSDGNDVFEPGEIVEVAPTWHNNTPVSESLAGTASDFTGPEGALYTLVLDHADYGFLEPGQAASCLETEVCYQMSVDDPAVRPATHWEATFDETLSDSEETTKTWTLHIGNSFADVPSSNLFYPSVETLLHHGITGGCTDTEYCPTANNTRDQMPVFVLRALEGADYTPPACVEGAEVFHDVAAGNVFCPWIEELANRGVVSGCGGDNYCPSAPVTRDQMAIFLLRTLEGSDYEPPACTGQFVDVPCPSLFADWIEELFAREITGGCSNQPPRYCPSSPVNREQMAAFLGKAFGLTLYGP